MKSTNLKIYSETGRYPEYGTSGSAAFDIEIKDDVTWEIYGENCTTTFGTGIYVIIPEGHVLKIFPRSGFGFKYEMILVNTVGVIDSDFRGEIKIKLKAPRRFHDLLPTKKGTRIVQAILEKIPKVNIVKVSKEVIENDKTDRGEGGFGSTGEGKKKFRNKKYSQPEIIEKFKKVHGNKYDYSKVDYKTVQTKVEIICSKHGSFFQLPQNHLRGNGCPICGSTLLQKTEVLKRFKKVHGNKYDYSEVEYVNRNLKIKIGCPIHGVFLQSAGGHFQGQGCPKCSPSMKLSQPEIIEKFKKVHGNKYDYSKVDFINTMVKVEIICPKHGSFLQKPNSHLQGSGCPNCWEKNKNSKGIQRIRKYLEENDIIFEQEFKFKWCKNINPLPFDFYLLERNILIEFDGAQHYKSVKYFGGKQTLIKIQKRDKIKTDFAKKENIKLIRIPYWDYKNIEKILKKELF